MFSSFFRKRKDHFFCVCAKFFSFLHFFCTFCTDAHVADGQVKQFRGYFWLFLDVNGYFLAFRLGNPASQTGEIV